MTTAEAKKFLAGKGCPSCEFGTICVTCNGTGVLPGSRFAMTTCSHCNGRRSLYVRLFNGQVSYDYTPYVKTLTPEQFRDAKKIGLPENKVARDGAYQVFHLVCPFCEGETCRDCGGTGKFTPKRDEEREIAFMSSALEETDDPDAVMNLWY